MKLLDVSTWPSHRGKRELMKFIGGGKLSWKEMVIAKCMDCCAGYVDGAPRLQNI